MKIFQVITRSDLGGAQSVVVNLANYLQFEHEVIVIAGDGDGKMWDLLSSPIKREKVISLKRELSLINELKTYIQFKRLYLKYKPDVIHLHSSKAGILGRLAFPRNKLIYTVHGFDSIRVNYRKYLPLERILQARCKAIVGVSEYDKRNLLSEGISNNVKMIYNGIFSPKHIDDNPFKQIKYLRKVLCVARLSSPKRWDVFFEVANLLPQYAFIWIGNQCECEDKYPENVFFMGSLPIAGAYNEYADLFMLPSDYEGLPMTIIEAMSMGKPVVTSNVGGISEIVVNDENGYTVENIPEAFAKKIFYILEHQDIYNRFSQTALERYQKDLTVEKMVNGYMKIYDDILHGE